MKQKDCVSMCGYTKCSLIKNNFYLLILLKKTLMFHKANDLPRKINTS